MKKCYVFVSKKLLGYCFFNGDCFMRIVFPWRAFNCQYKQLNYIQIPPLILPQKVYECYLIVIENTVDLGLYNTHAHTRTHERTHAHAHTRAHTNQILSVVLTWYMASVSVIGCVINHLILLNKGQSKISHPVSPEISSAYISRLNDMPESTKETYL